MRKSLLAFILVLTIFTFIGAQAPDQQGQSQGVRFFQGTWQEALDQSKETGKPIFVDAYAVWCGPCKWMSANVFTNAQVGEFYNANFINYKFDMEKGEGPGFARQHRVTAYPTLFYFDRNGSMVKKVLGAQNTTQFIDIGKSVVASLN